MAEERGKAEGIGLLYLHQTGAASVWQIESVSEGTAWGAVSRYMPVGWLSQQPIDVTGTIGVTT